MANDADLFGDSSSDADTDDLIAAAKSQPIAKKKGAKKPAAKKGGKTKEKNVPGERLILLVSTRDLHIYQTLCAICFYV
jgi:hypothetical protein